MSILTFGNEQNYCLAIVKASEKYGLKHEHAESSVVAGEYFDSIQPELVIFCFDEVEKSEAALKSLYAHSEIAAFTGFTTLVLCSKNETQTALQFCLDGIFDDYLIAKPLQDGAQLEWRIQSLLPAHRATSKAIIQNILSQLEEMQRKLIDSHVEASSPDSGTNISNKEKLKKAHDELERELTSTLLPLVISENQTDNSTKKQAVTQSLDSLLGNYSNSIDGIIQSIFRSLVEQYKSLDINLHTASKIASSAVKPTVMIVDDNSGFREPVIQMLTDEGYSVISSDAGTKAVGMIIREAPDLVLMDYQMPAMDGLETIKQVRVLLNGAKAPVFFIVTGHSSEDIVHKAKEIGVDGFLVKPIRRLHLIEKVNAKLGHKKDET